MKQYIKIACYCCLAFLSVIARAQSPAKPLIRNFAPEDYGAHSQNLGIVQDKRGLIYFANISGALEFDGRDWSLFRIGRNQMCYSLNMDESGKIFTGGNGQFGYLKPDRAGILNYESLSQTLPDSLKTFTSIWNTHVVDGKVYFNALKYLFECEGDSIHIIRPKKEFHLSFQVNDRIWILEKEFGLFKIEGGKAAFIPGSEFFTGKSIFAILPYTGNSVLVATSEYGLYIFNPGSGEKDRIVPFAANLTSRLVNAQVYGGIRLQDDNFAFNTLQAGVFIVSPQGKLLQTIGREEGLQNETVINLMQDHHGQLWCALNNGISVISLNSPLTFAREGSGFFGAIQSIVRHEEKIYLTTSQGVFKLEEGMEDPASGKYGHRFERIRGISGQCFDLKSIDGDLLVASNGVFEVKDQEAVKVGNVQSRVLYQVKNDDRTVVLSGGREGLSVLIKEGGKWSQGLVIDDLPDEITGICQDFTHQSPDNAMCFWLGTWTKGAVHICFDQDFGSYQTRVFGTSAGLPESEVHPFYLKGQVHFETGAGLYAFDPRHQKFDVDTTLGPELANGTVYIYRLSETGDQKFWISSGTRVYLASEDREDHILLDSIPFLGINIGGINAIYPEGDGTCWIGGDDGLAFYNGNIKKDYRSPYNGLIRNVLLGDDSVLFGGNYLLNKSIHLEQPEAYLLHLPYSRRSISFEYTASFYEYPDQLRYSYMLEGYDQGYSSWKRETKAVYTNLDHGSYTFRVKARNIYYNESREAVYRFTILPPWYLTWWAYLLYAALAVLVFVSGIKIYSRRLVREKQVLEAIVKERTIELARKNVQLEKTNQEISDQKELLEEKNRDITDSIVYAEKIQRALLTSHEFLEKVFPEYFVLYKPKSILSGDFYWAYEIKHDDMSSKVVYVTADCTGHGVPGALMSIIGHSLLNEIVVENKISAPERILDELRLGVIRALSQSGEQGKTRDGMDLTVCIWDKSAGRLSFSGANNPLYLVRDNDLQEIKGDKQPVGYFTGNHVPFTSQEIELKKGDLLYTFSDGYADQFGGPEKKKFKYGRFKKLLLEIAGKPMGEQKMILETTIEAWKGEMEQIDDICVVGIRV